MYFNVLFYFYSYITFNLFLIIIDFDSNNSKLVAQKSRHKTRRYRIFKKRKIINLQLFIPEGHEAPPHLALW